MLLAMNTAVEIFIQNNDHFVSILYIEVKNMAKKETKKNIGENGSNELYSKISIALGIILILVALYNSTQIYSFGDYDKKIPVPKIQDKPPEIKIAAITADSCKDCFNIGDVVNYIESNNVNVVENKKYDISSNEATALIAKYGIERVPTLIISGEYEKATSLMFKLRNFGEDKNGSFVFTKTEPPFVETASGKIRGVVSLIELDKKNCIKCQNLTQMIVALSNAGIKIGEQKEIDIDSNAGKELIRKYNITKVPTVIMSPDAGIYATIQKNWDQIGSIEDDGYYVMRELIPPYYSIEERKVRGLVSLTVLEDKTCKECYNATAFHKQILNRMNVAIVSERIVDAATSEGRNLIGKYKIMKLPMIILQGDIEAYPALVSAWKDVGSMEPDGTYVFRSVEIAEKSYKDLKTGKVVTFGRNALNETANETTGLVRTGQ